MRISGRGPEPACRWRGPALREKWLLDDWGPIPEPQSATWEWLRTAGEALVIAIVFTSGMFVFVLGVVVSVVVLAALLYVCPLVSACGGSTEGSRS